MMTPASLIVYCTPQVTPEPSETIDMWETQSKRGRVKDRFTYQFLMNVQRISNIHERYCSFLRMIYVYESQTTERKRRKRERETHSDWNWARQKPGIRKSKSWSLIGVAGALILLSHMCYQEAGSETE